MTVLGSSILQNFYQEFLNTELTYSKEVSIGLGLLPETTLRWKGEVFPCVVHSCSFQAAKVLVRLNAGQGKAGEFGNRTTTLTLTFREPGSAKKDLYQFNGTTQILQQHGAEEGERSILLEMTFNHQPAEGFLQIQGSYLALKKEAHQRKEDRIPLTAENKDLLGLGNLNTTITIDHIERKCLLRELSFSGAKVILTGVAPFLIDKNFSLSVPIAEKTSVLISGKIVRAEAVEGHRGMAVIALGYQQDQVPMDYLKVLQKGLKLGLGAKKPTF
jgi:hypothetical protein